jgi:transcriptional regulator with XRE-family HTH domain
VYNKSLDGSEKVKKLDISSEDLIKLGSRIRQVREKLGFIQAEFGKRLDVSKSSIINYESSKRMPDALNLLKIIRGFNINPEWLMLGNGGMFKDDELNIETKEPIDIEVIKMIEYMKIPTIELILKAEFLRIKKIFEPIIAEYEESKNKNT